jgi:hypothetical protein
MSSVPGLKIGSAMLRVARKNPDNAMDDSSEAVLDWIYGLFVFEISPRSESIARSLAALPRACSALGNDHTVSIPSTIRRDPFPENFISWFRSDLVASEWRFNENDIIRDRQHPTAATLDSSITLLPFLKADSDVTF